MNACSRCRSYAINYHLHGRDWDSTDADLCDVCYWRKRAEAALTPPEGYVLVPVEPTDRMIGEGILAYDGKCESSYTAMLAARPEVKGD